MQEVTCQNFNHTFPILQNVLKNATFIAIDAEFTGLRVNDKTKYSLFDSAKERYEMLRQDIEPYIIIQFGITAFERMKWKNGYQVAAYSFFLKPSSLSSESKFSCQTTALEFLSSNNFDFNKVVHYGIPYLNKSEEVALRRQLKENTLVNNIEQCMSYKDENDIRNFSNNVNEWLHDMNGNSDTLRIGALSPIMQYVLHKELRNRFQNIWTMSQLQSVIVFKVIPSVRKQLQAEEGDSLEYILLDSYIGFTKVFQLLVDLKKPIIGHNILLDLMFMHKQFYKSLPKKYCDFKNNIHQLFPTIFDTKYLSFELQEVLTKKERWSINSLSDMFTYFTRGPGKFLILSSPNVYLSDEQHFPNSEKYHDAGWDAYCTGFIFIKMIHIFSNKGYCINVPTKILTNTEIFNAVKKFSNCINIVRGASSYMKLDGPDPETTRPPWLFIKTLKPQPLNVTQITKVLSAFGTVDVKLLRSRNALVAVGSCRIATDILQHFQSSKELYVVPYNHLRHSPSVRIALWSGVIFSSGILTWMLHQTFKKNLFFDTTSKMT